MKSQVSLCIGQNITTPPANKKNAEKKFSIPSGEEWVWD